MQLSYAISYNNTEKTFIKQIKEKLYNLIKLFLWFSFPISLLDGEFISESQKNIYPRPTQEPLPE